jgi:hypothetical protein
LATWRLRFDLAIGVTGAGLVLVHYSPTNPVPDVVVRFVSADFFGPVNGVSFGICEDVANATVRLDGIVITNQGMPA